jgi:hypothetical protein
LRRSFCPASTVLNRSRAVKSCLRIIKGVR